jgi:hypothetical protein
MPAEVFQRTTLPIHAKQRLTVWEVMQRDAAVRCALQATVLALVHCRLDTQYLTPCVAALLLLQLVATGEMADLHELYRFCSSAAAHSERLSPRQQPFYLAHWADYLKAKEWFKGLQNAELPICQPACPHQPACHPCRLLWAG